MKVALPTKGQDVDGHFGHCEFFTIFTLDENKTIIDEEILQAPSGCGCKSEIVPSLAQKGVAVMLAGNMGQGAVNKLTANGIDVIRGCAGNVRTVTESWIAGNLDDSGIGCEAHEGCDDHRRI